MFVQMLQPSVLCPAVSLKHDYTILLLLDCLCWYYINSVFRLAFQMGHPVGGHYRHEASHYKHVDIYYRFMMASVDM